MFVLIESVGGRLCSVEARLGSSGVRVYDTLEKAQEAMNWWVKDCLAGEQPDVSHGVWARWAYVGSGEDNHQWHIFEAED